MKKSLIPKIAMLLMPMAFIGCFSFPDFNNDHRKDRVELSTLAREQQKEGIDKKRLDINLAFSKSSKASFVGVKSIDGYIMDYKIMDHNKDGELDVLYLALSEDGKYALVALYGNCDGRFETKQIGLLGEIGSIRDTSSSAKGDLINKLLREQQNPNI